MRARGLVAANMVATFTLIVYGGYVASTGSGMGCGPDWPLCNGVLVPYLHGATLVEYTHRLLGLLVAALTAAIVWHAWQSKARHLLVPAAWSAGLLAGQIMFGAIVVWLDLPHLIVTLHLLVAMAFLGTQLWLWVASAPNLERRATAQLPPGLPAGSAWALLLVYTVIGLGALVKHTDAGIACGYLTCYSQVLPTSAAGWLQTLHRAAAVGTSAYILWLAFRSLRDVWLRPFQVRLAIIALVTLFQVAVGVTVIATQLSLLYAVMHLAGATLLFGLLAELELSIWCSHLVGQPETRHGRARAAHSA